MYVNDMPLILKEHIIWPCLKADHTVESQVLFLVVFRAIFIIWKEFEILVEPVNLNEICVSYGA
jgi:hypothetical protein